MQMIDHIRSELKVYIGIVLTAVTLTIGVLAWANSNFSTIDRAEIVHKQMIADSNYADNQLAASIKTIGEKQAETNKLLEELIDRRSLDKINADIRETRASIAYWEKFIIANDANDGADNPLGPLRQKLEDLEFKRECIIRNNPRCN
jgi:hypothetical protein